MCEGGLSRTASRCKTFAGSCKSFARIGDLVEISGVLRLRRVVFSLDDNFL